MKLPLPGSIEYRLWMAQQNRKDRLARTAPEAPAGLSATNDSGNVVLTWPVVPGFVVTLYRGTTDVYADATELQSFDGGTSFIDDSVASGTAYWYWLTATNAAGEGGPSDVSTVTTP